MTILQDLRYAVRPLMMDTLLQDVRYAIRTLAKSPGFTSIALLTLALGIGANTAMFSVFYGVLLRPLPYAEPERIVGLAQTYPGGRGVRNLTYMQFEFLQRNAAMFESVAAAASVGFNLSDGAQADRVYGLRVSKDYFHVLGVAPALGRAFLPEEDQPNAPGAIILSHGLWQRRFGGDSDVIGRAVLLDGTPTTVVGVMPASFHSPNGADAWSTLAQVGRTVGGGSNLAIIGRLATGTSLAQARGDMARFTEPFRTLFSRSVSKDATLDLDSYRSQITSDVRTPVRVLLGAIAFVLLIACANVASLMLGRSAARQHEIAVRTALGATRGRVMRQLLTESVLLGLVGGALGLLVASWGVSALLALEPNALPGTTEIQLDRWALAFTFGLSVFTGLAFGVAPAWQASRASSARVIGSRQQARLRNGLVVGEIALSLILLVGAGLLIQTFARLIGTDPGFETRRLVSAEIWLTGTRYDSTRAISGFYRDLTSRLAALPGVQGAAVVEAGLPLQQGGNATVIVSESRLSIDYRVITPGYFRTLGAALLEGRDFSESDAAGAAPVVIVNESFVRRHLTGAATLGSLITVEDQPRQVVGVVRDVRSYVGWPAPPTVFVPSAQTPASLTRLFGSWFPTHVVVRMSGDPKSAQGFLTGIIREADALVPIGRVRPMEDVLLGSLSFQRFLMTLLSVFGGLAITLAAIGLYGVIAYVVAERTHEIGVRMALGARARDVLRMVLGRGLRLVALGLALGLAGALGLTRFIASQLYGVRAMDPVTFASVSALLALVALVACWLPARRAARVDPLIALRNE